MNKHNLPEIPQFAAKSGMGFEITSKALLKWDNELQPVADNDDASISIMDVIGSDMFGEGVTLRRISAALRHIGDRDITVNVNSPGGNFLEGLAIYNAIRAHKKEVTIRVLGIAASAASIIAMAGDRIEVPRAGFMMIHNAWGAVVGDRYDMQDASNLAERFDKVMASVYSARTGIDAKDVSKMMDQETWIGGDEAIEKGFADALLPADQAVKLPASSKEKGSKNAALHKLEAVMASAKVPRSERRRLLADAFAVMPGADEDNMPGAVVSEETRAMLAQINIT